VPSQAELSTPTPILGDSAPGVVKRKTDDETARDESEAKASAEEEQKGAKRSV
jgi:hypothetical protein